MTITQLIHELQQLAKQDEECFVWHEHGVSHALQQIKAVKAWPDMVVIETEEAKV